MQLVPAEQLVNEATLVPLYGIDRARGVAAYVKEFLQFKSNFTSGDISAGFYESQGRRWLLINCPLTLSTSPEPTVVNVGVAFPPLFPQKWPYCVITDKSFGGRTLVASHPFIAPNGVIRSLSLPLLQSRAVEDTPPALIEIILAIQEGLSDVAPFVSAAEASASTPTSSVKVASPSATLTTAVQVSPQRAGLTKAATDAILAHLHAKADEFLDTREQGLKHLAFLTASRDALCALESSLIEKKKQLTAMEAPIMVASSQCAAWRAKYPDGASIDPQSCIEPVDSSNATAMHLLAEIHAHDDAYDLLERCLKKNQISCDEYVRDVSGVAREQFVAKFKLQRLTSRSSAKATSAATAGGGSSGSSLNPQQQLRQQFSTMEPQLVDDVLYNAGGNYELASAQLRAMSS